MAARPVISVVTPTRNRRTLLGETMASVQAQDFAAWEHIVVDDGSDDGTVEAVQARAAADPRFRLLRREGDRTGANVCRNQGVRAARGELVVLLDSDDLLRPGCLSRRAEVMARNADLDFAVFQPSFFWSRPGDIDRAADDLSGDDLLRFLMFETPWIITGPVWRRDVLLRLGGFDESLLSWQDIELHVRALTAGCRYLRFAEVDHDVRWSHEPGRISVQQHRSPQHLTATVAMLETLEGQVGQGPGMNWVRRRALCSLYFLLAERWIEAGHMAEALEAWRIARRRGLAPASLHLTGAALLSLQAPRSPLRPIGARAAHKWKGWARMRTNPELVR